MMIHVYGRRPYGRVHAHNGEYADTQFVHFDLVPLYPVRSFWVTHAAGDGERLGFPIKLHMRSVIATYLRVWGPCLAAFAFVISTSPATTAVSAALAGLSAWSWTWRSRRGALSRQRSDFDQLALGSRCDPAWMTAEMRNRLARSLTSQLTRREGARSPDDVARFGARDIDEAVLAYGLLRLDGVVHRGSAAAADRLLTSSFDERPSDGGPYRERVTTSVPGLGDAISAAARAQEEAAHARSHAARSAAKPHWLRRPWVQLGLLVFCMPLTLGISPVIEYEAPYAVSATQLASPQPPVGRRVAVQCDRIPEDYGTVVSKGNAVMQRVALCRLGSQLLPVVSVSGNTTDAAALEGELRFIPDHGGGYEPWVDALYRDTDSDVHFYKVYLWRENPASHRLDFIACVCGLAVIAGWVLWICAFLRRAVRRLRSAVGRLRSAPREASAAGERHPPAR